MSRRRTSEEERQLWREAMREVRPLAKSVSRISDSLPLREDERSAKKREPGDVVPPLAPPPPLPKRSSRAALPPPAGLDRRTAARLRRGQLPLEAQLDLHGMTQEEAYRSLLTFLRGAARQSKRVLLVITGKGDAAAFGERGVLRRCLPLWLEEPSLRGLVLASAPARPEHGGGGAFYLLLRRRGRGGQE